MKPGARQDLWLFTGPGSGGRPACRLASSLPSTGLPAFGAGLHGSVPWLRLVSVGGEMARLCLYLLEDDLGTLRSCERLEVTGSRHLPEPRAVELQCSQRSLEAPGSVISQVEAYILLSCVYEWYPAPETISHSRPGTDETGWCQGKASGGCPSGANFWI